MENPRSDKVATVEEVTEKLQNADAALLTEYRGLTVAQLSELRAAMGVGGGEYKIYKNTLVRIAAKNVGVELAPMLTGPTAIAFVSTKADGTPGDPVIVAKALQAFAKGNEKLVVKGGVLGEKLLDVDEVKALANVAPREELLARLAGGFAAPMQQFASLLQAVPRDFAYGLQALIEKGGADDAPASTAAPAAEETVAEESSDTSSNEPVAEAPEAEAVADADAAATETPTEEGES